MLIKSDFCVYLQKRGGDGSQVSFIHSFIFVLAFLLGMVARDSSQPIISKSSAGSTPRWDQGKSEMESRQLILGRPLGCFLVGVANSTCLANLSCDIPDIWPNQSSRDLSIQRRIGWTFTALRVSQLRTFLRIFTPWTLRKYPISAACNQDSIRSVITWDLRPEVRLEQRPIQKPTALRCLKAPVLSPERWSSCRATYVLPICLSVSLFRLPSFVNTIQRSLNFSTSCRVLLFTFSINYPGVLEKHNTSVFLVLILILALCAAENRLSEYWRPCWENSSRTKSSAKTKRLVLYLQTESPSWLSI